MSQTSGREVSTNRNEEHLSMTPAKSRSISLPGHCRTANMSIHTCRLGSAHQLTAATRSPHGAVQQRLMKVRTGPTKSFISGNSQYRQCRCRGSGSSRFSVGGTTSSRRTFQVGESQQSCVMVKSTSQPISTPRSWESAEDSSLLLKRSLSCCRICAKTYVLFVSFHYNFAITTMKLVFWHPQLQEWVLTR